MFVWWWFPSGSDIAFFQYSPEKQEITGGTSSIRVGMGEVSRGNNQSGSCSWRQSGFPALEWVMNVTLFSPKRCLQR
jgi:hypothetical protein